MARKLPPECSALVGWDPRNDHLEAGDFSPMIEHVLFVKFTER
jgi:hypothetical protein